MKCILTPAPDAGRTLSLNTSTTMEVPSLIKTGTALRGPPPLALIQAPKKKGSTPGQNASSVEVVKLFTLLQDSKKYTLVQTTSGQSPRIIKFEGAAEHLASHKKEDNSCEEKSAVKDAQVRVVSKPAVPPKTIVKEAPLRYECTKCKVQVNDKNELSAHFKDAHGGAQGFTMFLVQDATPTTDVQAQESSLDRKKKQYSCNICKALYDSSFQLYKHYKDDHDIDNPYLKKSKEDKPCPSTDRERYRAQCEACGIHVSSRHALSRHMKNIHGPSTGICHFCGNSYRMSTLPAHEKICCSKSVPRRRQDCMHEGCGASYFKKEQLIDHVRNVHGMKIRPMLTLEFPSQDEFKQWKEEEEDRTFSYYSKHAGTKRNVVTYYCQHEGSERSHRSSLDTRGKGKQNKKGRIKKGITCTSYLRAKMTENGITAYYWPTHSHAVSPEDVKHQPLSKEIIQFIKEQIALNVPNRQIQAMVKKRLSENPSTRRDTLVSLKRITSMAQRFRRNNGLQDKTNVPVETFNSFIDVLCNQDNSPVLFYQPPSEDANLNGCNQEDHLFFLALQTPDQQKMLQRETAMPMFISVTKADYTLQYYLISISVPCENNFEYPVGHLISSQMNEEVVSLFLQTIGERCPELNVNCIVSMDSPEINSAIRKVFGADGPYLLSKWHLLEFMQRDFLKAVESSKAEEIFDFILAMADAQNEDRFIFLYNSFREQFESSHPNIVSDFADYFVRAAEWAGCYRQDPGIVDSCLYNSSFFSKLNKRFRRRPSKSLSLLPDLLLFLQESYRERRESEEIPTQLVEDMSEHHAMGVEIPLELIQETCARHWTVQASKHGQVFYVMQCLAKCSQNNCSLRCKDCSGLCSHMYFCTCGKSETICLHIHRIHLLTGSDNEPEGNAADTEMNEMDQVEATEYITGSPVQIEEESENGDDSEVKRAAILKHLDSLKQIVEQRCVPEEVLTVIHDTLQNLSSYIDTA